MFVFLFSYHKRHIEFNFLFSLPPSLFLLFFPTSHQARSRFSKDLLSIDDEWTTVWGWNVLRWRLSCGFDSRGTSVGIEFSHYSFFRCVEEEEEEDKFFIWIFLLNRHSIKLMNFWADILLLGRSTLLFKRRKKIWLPDWRDAPNSYSYEELPITIWIDDIFTAHLLVGFARFPHIPLQDPSTQRSCVVLASWETARKPCKGPHVRYRFRTNLICLERAGRVGWIPSSEQPHWLCHDFHILHGVVERRRRVR